VVVVQRRRLEDSRGFFSRLYCAAEMTAAGVHKPLAQINQTLTRLKGTVRGMHFQRPPHAETKIVSCLAGEIFDVAVDLRRGSPTFLRWHGEILSPGNQRSLFIPEGVAHGFQALADDCELLYLHTEAFYPESEAAVHAEDPRLAIHWPLTISAMSDRDRSHAMLTATFDGISL
jgi:dTDP-4-dehydrorhamnose 3,5-epimerase